MDIERTLPLLDSILDEWAARIGADLPGYRNHCYRMLHFCFWLLGTPTPDQRRKLEVAAAFHDLGIWSDDTLDYIPPSVREAESWARDHGMTEDAGEIGLMVGTHHQLRGNQVAQFPLVEVFRKADLVDFSLGLVRHGVPATVIREVKAAFPNAGFHRRLVQLSWRQLKTHPLDPLPMMKW